MSSAARRRGHRYESRVLQVLRETGPLTRRDLGERLGVKRATLSEVTSRLIKAGAIRTLSSRRERSQGRGRPAELLCLVPQAGQYLGLDFGHSRVSAVIVNASHEVIADGERSYSARCGLNHRLQIAFDLVDELSSRTGATLVSLHSIGIGVPGPYTEVPLTQATTPRREVRPWGAGAQWKREVLERVEARFNAPVVVDNNVRFAGLAESCWDRSTPSDNLVFLKLSDGVGGALVVAERLVTGENGFGGELGHVTIDAAGEACRCGKRGCLETIAATWAILRAARARGLAVESLADLRTHLDRGNPAADEVVREVGDAIGRVLGIVCIVVNPAEIVVGGDAAEALPELLFYAGAAIQAELLPVNETRPSLRRARLGSKAGALGAVTALFHMSPVIQERS